MKGVYCVHNMHVFVSCGYFAKLSDCTQYLFPAGILRDSATVHNICFLRVFCETQRLYTIFVSCGYFAKLMQPLYTICMYLFPAGIFCKTQPHAVLLHAERCHGCREYCCKFAAHGG